MEAAKVSKRRTFPADHGSGNDVSPSAASTTTSAAAVEEPETPLPSHLPPSPYSAALTGARRHARAGAAPASARSAGAAASEAAAAEGEAPSVDDARGGRECQKRHARKNSNGDNNNSSSNSLRSTGAATGSATTPVAAAVLQWRRARRLLWAFWRRRAVVSLRASLELRLSRLLRHTWGRRLVFAAAVVLAGLFWFLVITAVVGPAGGGGGGRGGERGGKNGAKGSGGGERPYYRRIVGEVGVGPSLSDPWMVREIDIAAADWGSFHDGSSADGGGESGDSSGGGGGGGGVGASEGAAIGSEAGGGGGGRKKRDEWDGIVNGVVTGELEPVGGAKTRPKVDLLLTIFSGSTEADADKRHLLRQIYDKYEGWVKVGGPNSITGGTNPERREFTVSVVFVMSKDTAPPEGELVGDILYVPVPEGYRNIVLKTKAMLCLVRHFDFEYLLKADDDSFVCLARIASMLHDLPPEIRGKVYAGVPTACNQSTNPDYWNGRVMKNPDHRWFDSKYVQHTLGGLDCFPAYMQGAFYILAQPLVEHLYRGHEHLECFTNEDVTIGSWLMGVDRELVEMYNMLTSHLWDCLCARTQITTKTRRKQMFFHNCKGQSQLKLCGTRLLRPGIGC